MTPPDGIDAARIAAEAVAGAVPPDPDAPWPKPDLSLVRAETVSAPAVPDNMFPPFWARWTADAAEGAGAPHAFVATALLGAAGAVLGNARWASPWHPWKDPPVVNVALVGRPSSGKSPALDALQDLLSKIEAHGNADWPDRRRAHERDLVVAKERRAVWEREAKEAAGRRTPAPPMPADAEEPKPPQRNRLYSTDTTIEKATRLSDVNPRGLIVLRDELAGWLAGMDRYAGTAGGDRPFWLQAYGGRPWTADRVKDGADPIHVPHLLWSIIGTIQPDRVASLLMAGDDDGLTARFLYCWPDPVPPRQPRSAADTAGAFAALRRLREIPWPDAPEPKILPFDGAAIAALQEWREQIAAMEAEAAGLMLSWLGKLPGLAVRLALILTMLEWSAAPDATLEPEAIGERATVAAIAFLDGFAIPMARRTFGAAALPEAERDARRLARWLMAQHPMPEVVNAKELRRMAGGPAIPDSARTEAALAELAAAGWVRPAPSRAGGSFGRSRKDWAVNPGLRETRQ